MPAANSTETVCPLVSDSIWLDKFKYQDAERMYYERLAKLRKGEMEKQAQLGPVNGKVEEEEECVADVVVEEEEEEEEEVVVGHVLAPTPQVGQRGPVIQEEMSTESQPKEAKEKRNKASRKGRHRNAVGQTKEKGAAASSSPSRPPSIASQIAKAREHIKNSLECVESIATVAAAGSKVGSVGSEVTSRLEELEKTNSALKTEVDNLRRMVTTLQQRVQALEVTCNQKQEQPKPPVAKKEVKKEEEDDDVDLFGSESEEEDDDEAVKVREQRLAEYAAKKSKKPAVVAKSSIILDVKPWDDETDMSAMEKCVRQIEADGLLWGASKLVPLAYGIHKLQIGCVIEDEKISTEWLTETIEANEDYVQSVDIAAFNKV